MPARPAPAPARRTPATPRPPAAADRPAGPRSPRGRMLAVLRAKPSA